jgi:hypothetical protein
MLLILASVRLNQLVSGEKIAWTSVRRLERFCGNPRHSLRSTTQKASGPVHSVLLPSLIAQIPAFSVMGQGRRSISLAVDFLSPAERHAGSEVCNALRLSPFQRAREFSVAAFDFLCIEFFAQGREPASEQRHWLEIAVTIAVADV